MTYRQAKAFIAAAQPVQTYSDPTVFMALYRASDGTLWHFQESRLDSPEGGWLLEKIGCAEDQAAGVASVSSK